MLSSDILFSNVLFCCIRVVMVLLDCPKESFKSFIFRLIMFLTSSRACMLLLMII